MLTLTLTSPQVLGDTTMLATHQHSQPAATDYLPLSLPTSSSGREEDYADARTDRSFYEEGYPINPTRNLCFQIL
ncbi:hypothetical protein ACLOJK_016524 [Asimina triloba]